MTEFSEKRDPKKSYSDPNGMNFEFIFGLQNHTSAGHALAMHWPKIQISKFYYWTPFIREFHYNVISEKTLVLVLENCIYT